jgi:hypothetical protein
VQSFSVWRSSAAGCRKANGNLCAQCNNGWYGPSCAESCNSRCRTSNGTQVCSIETGECVCDGQRYGDFCERICANCANGLDVSVSACSSIGLCRFGCVPGVFGDYCDRWCGVNCVQCDRQLGCTACKSGFFGSKCQHACSSGCAAVVSADNVSTPEPCSQLGVCLHGCASNSTWSALRRCGVRSRHGLQSVYRRLLFADV